MSAAHATPQAAVQADLNRSKLKHYSPKAETLALLVPEKGTKR